MLGFKKTMIFLMQIGSNKRFTIIGRWVRSKLMKKKKNKNYVQKYLCLDFDCKV